MSLQDAIDLLQLQVSWFEMQSYEAEDGTNYTRSTEGQSDKDITAQVTEATGIILDAVNQGILHT